MERLEAIRKRAEQATPGPWTLAKGFPLVYSEKAKEDRPGELRRPPKSVDVLDLHDPEDSGVSMTQWRRNLRFITAARDDVPWLCEQVTALRAELAAAGARERVLREALEFYAGDGDRVVTVDVQNERLPSLPGCRKIIDTGERARAALATPPSEALTKLLTDERERCIAAGEAFIETMKRTYEELELLPQMGPKIAALEALIIVMRDLPATPAMESEGA